MVGQAGSLHIDCWAEIDHADGHNVSLRPEPHAGAERLYYVNLGGYDPSDFSEKHRNMFVVAENVAQAKSRALRTVKDWDAAHRDDLHEAEQAFSLDGKGGDQRFHIVVNAHPMIAPASPNMLSAGTIIAGSLITGLRSDLPGSGRGDGNAERL